MECCKEFETKRAHEIPNHGMMLIFGQYVQWLKNHLANVQHATQEERKSMVRSMTGDQCNARRHRLTYLWTFGGCKGSFDPNPWCHSWTLHEASGVDSGSAQSATWRHLVMHSGHQSNHRVTPMTTWRRTQKKDSDTLHGQQDGRNQGGPKQVRDGKGLG